MARPNKGAERDIFVDNKPHLKRRLPLLEGEEGPQESDLAQTTEQKDPATPEVPKTDPYRDQYEERRKNDQTR